MKPCKLVDNYFINVSFLTVMEMEQSQDMLIASVMLCLELTYVFHRLKTDAPCSTGGADIAQILQAIMQNAVPFQLENLKSPVHDCGRKS